MEADQAQTNASKLVVNQAILFPAFKICVYSAISAASRLPMINSAGMEAVKKDRYTQPGTKPNSGNRLLLP
jgi:hypothetical protein